VHSTAQVARREFICLAHIDQHIRLANGLLCIRNGYLLNAGFGCDDKVVCGFHQ
jgi:hypothetical protein